MSYAYLDIETRPSCRIWELPEDDQRYLMTKAAPGLDAGPTTEQVDLYREHCRTHGSLATAKAMPLMHAAESAMAVNPALCAIVCVGVYLDAEARAEYLANEPNWVSNSSPDVDPQKGTGLLLTHEAAAAEVGLPGVQTLWFQDPKDTYEVLGDLLGAATVVTFNGRRFDLPILMVHAAAAGVQLPRNLVPHRYRYDECMDLADMLTSFGAGSLARFGDYCRLFGVPSPKEEEITGKYVGAAVFDGRLEEVFAYQMRDIKALARLAPKVRRGFDAAIKNKPLRRPARALQPVGVAS